MTFNSIPFIILFPIAVILFYVLPARFRYIWLLLLSYAFYYAAGGAFLMLLAALTVITYISALAIDSFDGPGIRKTILILTLLVSLCTLFAFKYLNLALELSGSALRVDIILPLGISFYTFQAVSYIMDVYRRKIPGEKNILKLALYLSFFLSIVSGPINRAGDIIPQLEGAKRADLEQIKTGMQKMLWGYFLKLAIAGRLAIVVDNVYGDASAWSGSAIAFTALAYIFMLYCDFEGYSQIAIGSGYILGIKMKENFIQPFYSTGMGELWRRWHVSLSTWFRDYLYIPLGGNRHGKIRKYINLFIVLCVSGIWHGANLTFLIWGAINGFFIVAGQILLPFRDKAAGSVKEKLCGTPEAEKIFDATRRIFLRIGVYILTAYTFIWFANKDVKSAYLAIKGILTRFSALPGEVFSLGLGRTGLFLTLAMAAFVLVADGAANARGTDTPSLIKNIPAALRWALYWALLIAILFSANLTGKEFIYAAM